MPKCFTCVNKISIPVDLEIRRKWSKITGKLFMPKLVFICAKTGLRIEQTLPACHQFEADETMTELADSLKNFAKNMRLDFSNAEEEIEFCEECESPIRTVDGYTSCDCEDSGYNTPGNYCARCEQKAVDCSCSQGFAYDERDKY